MHDGRGIVLGQTRIPAKTNGITAVRNLARDLDLRGRAITVDAMHGYSGTARILRGECGADYVMTAIKDNQPTVSAEPGTADWGRSDRCWETIGREHGRIEKRRCTLIDLNSPERNGRRRLHGRRQAVRTGRHFTTVKSGKVSEGTTYRVTSPGPEKADAAGMLAPMRGHWATDTGPHCIRDFTCDGDRCRVRVGHTPHNLACISDPAIAITRLDGRFTFIPEANRHFAARTRPTQSPTGFRLKTAESPRHADSGALRGRQSPKPTGRTDVTATPVPSRTSRGTDTESAVIDRGSANSSRN